MACITVNRCGSFAFKGAVAEAQGRRPTQEDAHSMRCVGTSADVWICDGHRGAGAARRGAEALAKSLGKSIYRPGGGTLPSVQRIETSFESVDTRLRQQLKKDGEESGATVVGAMAVQERDGTYSMVMMNCGDSRGVVIRCPSETKKSAKQVMVDLPESLERYMKEEDDWDADASWLPEWPAIVESIDHKPTFPLERKRIEAAGGRVSVKGGSKARLDGHLAVSRGLGDFQFKADVNRPASDQKVSCVPDVYSLTGLLPGTLVLLACDGLWDFVTTEYASSLVRKRLQRDPNYDLGEIAEELIKYSIRKGSGDNVTVLLVHMVEGDNYDSTTAESSDGRDGMVKNRASRKQRK